MDDTLRDALSIKVREEIDKVEVLEEERSILSDALCLVGVRHGDTVRRRVDVLLGLSIVVVRLDLYSIGTDSSRCQLFFLVESAPRGGDKQARQPARTLTLWLRPALKLLAAMIGGDVCVV